MAEYGKVYRSLGTVTAVMLLAGSLCAAGCDSDTNSSETSNEQKARQEASETERERDPSASGESEPPKDDSSPSAKLPGGDSPRTFEFTYEATLNPGDASGSVDIFLPVAIDTPHQTVLEHDIEAPFDGEIRQESTYGNKFWHASLDELPDTPQTVTMTYTVRREVFQRKELAEKAKANYSESTKKENELFLSSNRKVPVSGDLIDEVIGDIDFGDNPTPATEARAIYDYVVDTMEYKKQGDGWGNGDTYWACTEKYGNCTDFHALFTSLARNRGIPSRFEIGFPVPTDRKSGDIGGYHCWLQFYVPGVGWTPVDASEAHKHPELRETFFGTHPADRIQFTVGRDLELGEGHQTEPLNYFIYPHVEVGGKRYENVDTAFSYAETDA